MANERNENINKHGITKPSADVLNDLVFVITHFTEKFEEKASKYDREIIPKPAVASDQYQRIFSDPHKMYTGKVGKDVFEKVLGSDKKFSNVYNNYLDKISEENVHLYTRALKEMEAGEIKEETRMQIFENLKVHYDEIVNHLKNQNGLRFGDQTDDKKSKLLNENQIGSLVANLMFAVKSKVEEKALKNFSCSAETQSNVGELFRFISGNLHREDLNKSMVDSLANKETANKYLLKTNNPKDLKHTKTIVQYINAYGKENFKKIIFKIHDEDNKEFNNFIKTLKAENKNEYNPDRDKVIKFISIAITEKSIIQKLEELHKHYSSKDKNKDNPSPTTAKLNAILTAIKDKHTGGEFYIRNYLKIELQDFQSNNRSLVLFNKANTLTDGLSDILSQLKKYPIDKQKKDIASFKK
jgi:regulator of sigma D